ncbi:TlpA family protein disulfide reductase [Pseudoxanthomonas helianthi]|uniref:TlpA family protein disulfide reductase n=1 Tax=Pseudoxanthomonas helianthi TaxID=1453541 RepID=A0A940X3V9_9GAMM|nr:TlpA disulfide reductase family protein [Pseudoxanthomonas helianthi]MBP3984702.1 TlpA family protein disulfide reductase [Pseudoxanthomonas helianthi]
MENSRKTRGLLGVVAALALAGCSRSAEPPAPAKAEPAKAEAPAVAAATADFPTLKLPAVDGSTYELAAHRGRWVVVNFWATWCGPCLKEMPELSTLDQRRGDIDVVGLAYDDIETKDMQAFLKEHPVAYPIVIVDTFSPPADFATPRGLPTTYLIAPDGKVAKQFLGPVTAREIEAFVAKGA